MREQWIGVVGWEDLYQVSTHGNVRSVDRIVRNSRGFGKHKVRGKLLKPGKSWGRLLVVLSRNGLHTTRLVHHLVLEAFVGPCPEGMECCHYDGNALNNHLDNLRWDTRAGNVADAMRHGTHVHPVACGEKHPNSKLTDSRVRAIRAGHFAGMDYDGLANVHKVSKNAIACVVQRKTWKHVV